MPLLRLHRIDENCQWGFWETTETEAELWDRLTPNRYDEVYLQSITHEARRLAALAVRVLAQEMLSQWQLAYQGISKDAHERPYLAGYPYYISLSHTQGYAVVIMHRSQPVGVDIEAVQEKLRRVAHKFLNDAEFADSDNQLEKLCVYWCAKEVLYKKNGEKQLSLREQTHIHPFDGSPEGMLTGELNKNGGITKSTIVYTSQFGCIIAYSYQ